MRKTLAGLLAIAASMGAAPALQAQTVLKFGYTQSASDTHHAAAEHFKKRLEELTKGQLSVSLHPGGELGKDPQLLEGVRLGTVDIVQAGNPFFTRFAPELNALDIPFIFDDYAHVYRVIDGPTGRRLLDALDKQRMKGLAFWEIGFRNLTNSKRAVRTPKDLEGLKIRTTPNPAHVQAFKLLGAIPTPLPFPEVYLALETKTVDGQENPIDAIRAARFHEVQKHLSETRHAYTVSIVVMNAGKWDALGKDQQGAVLQAARDAQVFQRELNRKADASAIEVIKKAGVEVVSDPDAAAFKAIVLEAVKAEHVAKHGGVIVEAIAKAARK